ncbi:uncharacterized protein LOC124366720 [Homalodisca vitripennis]|uniref:uncharacterized protein LOC124366720 n=1 Tax=Homalodisca vitripennis TaxID=197043 RepID=UPI001EEBF82A|nr:uncharacterized protein LOC124366720 [Homalodisca vitripennis]
MERLPLEVLELVAENLTTKDLSACSAVSMSWRDIFNHDSLWKPHCNISIADYLETAECQVQPGFVSPVMENNKLSPICHWRMCFMRENHLFKNWRGMRYVVNKVKASHDSFFHSTFLSDDYLIEITDDYTTLQSTVTTLHCQLEVDATTSFSTTTMRLSGAEYKKRAKKKLEEQERVLKQTKRLDLFFKTPGEQEIAPVLEGPALDDSIF